jgi:hypothetical protein
MKTITMLEEDGMTADLAVEDQTLIRIQCGISLNNHHPKYNNLHCSKDKVVVVLGGEDLQVEWDKGDKGTRWAVGWG